MGMSKMIYWLELSSNELINSKRFTHLLSSTSARSSRSDCGPKGYYIHQPYFRDTLTITIVKLITKVNWINSNDVYSSRMGKELDHDNNKEHQAYLDNK